MELSSGNPLPFEGKETLVVVMDVWDNLWDKEAVARTNAMIPSMNVFLNYTREQDCQIIFTAFEVGGISTDANSRLLTWREKPLDLMKHRKHCPVNPELIEKSKLKGQVKSVPKSMHPGLCPDERDYVTNRCDQISAVYKMFNRIIFIGCHLNYCIIDRPTGIHAAKHFSQEVYFVPELVDIVYWDDVHPQSSHEEAKNEMVAWVEHNHCPSIRWEG